MPALGRYGPRGSLAGCRERCGDPVPPDGGLDGAGERVGRFVPYPFEQFLGRDWPSVRGEQAFQHGEFLGRERQAPPGADRDAAGRIQAQVTAYEADGQRGGGAPAQGPDARHQLGEIKRLGQVVIGAQVQAFDPLPDRRRCLDRVGYLRAGPCPRAVHAQPWRAGLPRSPTGRPEHPSARSRCWHQPRLAAVRRRGERLSACAARRCAAARVNSQVSSHVMSGTISRGGGVRDHSRDIWRAEPVRVPTRTT
jgi:hypothetical protein